MRTRTLPHAVVERRFALLATALCLAAGLAVGAQPMLPLGLIGVALAVGAFSTVPAGVLLAILLVRPSLDNIEALPSVGGVNAVGLIAASTVVGGGLALLWRRPSLPARGFLRVAGAFLALAAASLAWSFERAEGASAWIAIAMPLVVFALAAWIVRDEGGFRRLLTVVLLSAVIPVGVGIVQLATGQRLVKEGYASIQGTFVHPNGFGFFLLVVVSIGLVAFLEARTVQAKRALGLLVGLAAVCFFFTFTRSAWLAFVVVFGLLAALRYRRLALVGLAAIALAAAAFPSAAGQVTGRFADLSPSSAEYSNNSLSWRQTLRERMLPYGQERPLTGHGFGTYLPLSDVEIGVYDYEFQAEGESAAYMQTYPHNDYLFMFVELGVPGTLLWLATLVALTLVAWRARRVPNLRPYALALTGVLGMLIVVSAFDNVKNYQAVVTVLCALTGGLAGAARGHAAERVRSRLRLGPAASAELPARARERLPHAVA
jgi:putative inorganic carbon (HCO3(-)) transporter